MGLTFVCKVDFPEKVQFFYDSKVVVYYFNGKCGLVSIMLEPWQRKIKDLLEYFEELSTKNISIQ